MQGERENEKNEEEQENEEHRENEEEQEKGVHEEIDQDLCECGAPWPCLSLCQELEECCEGRGWEREREDGRAGGGRQGAQEGGQERGVHQQQGSLDVRLGAILKLSG